MFYNKQGKHVRTKKEILDENGNSRKGCRIVEKGEVYERSFFTAKNKLFKQENFVDEVKHFYTDLINLLVKDDKEKLHVFDSSGLYLATKKIGKNNPKDELIQFLCIGSYFFIKMYKVVCDMKVCYSNTQKRKCNNGALTIRKMQSKHIISARMLL